MHVELLQQAIGLEYEALALAAGPLTTLAVGWLLRQTALHLRTQRATGYAARLVAWAEQAIPDKSARYAEVAALLSRQFPMLSGEQIEVLIESEVLGLKKALRAATPAGGAIAAAGAATDTAGTSAASATAAGAVSLSADAAQPTVPEATPISGLRVGAG